MSTGTGTCVLHNGLIIVDLIQDGDEAVVAALDAGDWRLLELLPEDAHHAGHRLPAGQEVLPRVEHHGGVGGGLGRRLAHDPLEDALEDVKKVGEVGTRGFDGQLGDSFHGSGPNRPESHTQNQCWGSGSGSACFAPPGSGTGSACFGPPGSGSFPVLINVWGGLK
jgi:hypothetical protein